MSNLNQLDIEDSKETLEILFEMSQILNCGLSKETLNILITMIEKGVNPEALIRVVEELRKHNYSDSGVLIYDINKQKEVLAGGSGPACSPLVNYSYFFPLMERKIMKRILIVATGALFSPTFVYQKNSILSISHAVSLESV